VDDGKPWAAGAADRQLPPAGGGRLDTAGVRKVGNYVCGLF
jgi:hypothetical protein